MIQQIVRAIDLINIGSHLGAINTLESALKDAHELVEQNIKLKAQLAEKIERLEYWEKRARTAEANNELV